MQRYIFWLFPFLVSFATAAGALNEVYYVKLFAFEFLFIIMLIWKAFKKKRIVDFGLSVNVSDALILGLLVVYSCFYWGQYNIIDNSLFLLYFLFYFFVRFWSSEKDVHILMNIAPIVILLHLLLCSLQYFSIFPNLNSYFDIGSTFGNPDMLSAYLAVLLPFCYISSKWKVFRIIVILLTVSLFFYLQARTAIVATTITILLYCACRIKIPRLYIFIGVVVLILGIVFLINWHSISVLGRFYIWIVALSMVVAKPFGWGPYAFEKYYLEYQSKFTIDHPEIANALNYDIVHSPYNEFLNIAVTIGIVGLILYLLFTLFVLIIAYKTKSPLLFPLLVFQFVSLSYFPFQIIPLMVIYIICCSIVISTTSALFRIRIFYSFSRLKILTFCVLIPVIICLSLGLFSFGHWRKAIEQSCSMETYSQACGAFEKSYPFLKNNGRFLISYAELLHRMGNEQEAFALMYKAEHYFSDVGFLHNLALVYEKDGRICEAKEKFILATNMSPRNINISFAYLQFLQRIDEVKSAYWYGKSLQQKLVNSKTASGRETQFILRRVNEYIDKIEKGDIDAIISNTVVGNSPRSLE